MKNLKLLGLAIITSFLFACHTDLSINSINIDILNSKNEVTKGENLTIEFKIRDSEGIDYVQIEIPVLNVDIINDDYTNQNKWEFKEHFLVENVDVTGDFEVFITVLDKAGTVYMETKKFTIK